MNQAKRVAGRLALARVNDDVIARLKGEAVAARGGPGDSGLRAAAAVLEDAPAPGSQLGDGTGVGAAFAVASGPGREASPSQDGCTVPAFGSSVAQITSRDGAAAARRPHKPKVEGSSPSPATRNYHLYGSVTR